jgi:hypothetical protein
MRQPGPSRDSDAFLSALADELSFGPEQAIADRHVTASVAAARSARQLRRSQVIRTVAAALAVATVFGTGGMAAAGGLPAPIQAVVADMARALPVPFDLPYPKAVVGQTAFGDPAEVTRRPEDAEIGLDPLAPSEVVVGPPDQGAAATPPDNEGQEDSTGNPEVDHPGGDRDEWSDRDRDDRGSDDRGSDDQARDDRARDDRARDDQDRDDQGRDDQGRDDQGRDDQGADFGSSDSERSDETRDRTDDEEEERHDRQDESGHRSSDD